MRTPTADFLRLAVNAVLSEDNVIIKYQSKTMAFFIVFFFPFK